MRSAFRLGKDKELVTFANKVNQNQLSSNAEKSVAMYYLGKTAYNKGDLDQAIIAFEQVARISTNNQAAEARYLIAKAYYTQGKIADSETQIANSNEKNRAYPVWIAKSLLLQAQIFIDKDDLLNARAAVEAVQENFKDDANLLQEANEIMTEIETKENLSNRIRVENSDGTLQLDTTGN